MHGNGGGQPFFEYKVNSRHPVMRVVRPFRNRMERFALITCGIYRDGGSYGCVLADATGNHFSLFLEVVPWDNPKEPRAYETLWLSNEDIPDSHGESLAIDSSDYIRWRDIARVARIETSPPAAQSRFGEMIAAMFYNDISIEFGPDLVSLGGVDWICHIEDRGCVIAMDSPFPDSVVVHLGDRLLIQCIDGLHHSTVCGLDPIRGTPPYRFAILLDKRFDRSAIVPRAQVALAKTDEHNVGPKPPSVRFEL